MERIKTAAGGKQRSKGREMSVVRTMTTNTNHKIVMILLLFTGIMIKDGWKIMKQSFRGGLEWLSAATFSTGLQHTITHPSSPNLNHTYLIRSRTWPFFPLSCWKKYSDALPQRSPGVWRVAVLCVSKKEKVKDKQSYLSKICPRYRSRVYTTTGLGQIVIFGVTIAGNNICFLYM